MGERAFRGGKIVEPDPQSTEVGELVGGEVHAGERIGKYQNFCGVLARLRTTSDAEAGGKISSDEYQPEGMVQQLSSYSIELEGNINLKPLTNNIRFDLSIKLSTNQTWQEFSLRVSMRPDSWEISANAADEKLRLLVNDESGVWEQKYNFTDLQNPEKILQEFGGPMAVGFLAGMGMRPTQKNLSKLSLGLKWEAHNDWMRFGHSKVRVYRLETRLLDRFKVFIFVSRVGEILWVHLPNEVVLSNDEFEHF